MKIEVAGALLTCGHNILLVHQKTSRKWSLPKGHLENHESIEDCWKRELREETGLISNNYYCCWGRKQIGNSMIYYLSLPTDKMYLASCASALSTRPRNGNIEPAEINGIGWFDLSLAATFNLNYITKIAINSILSCSNPGTINFNKVNYAPVYFNVASYPKKPGTPLLKPPKTGYNRRFGKLLDLPTKPIIKEETDLLPCPIACNNESRQSNYKEFDLWNGPCLTIINI